MAEEARLVVLQLLNGRSDHAILDVVTTSSPKSELARKVWGRMFEFLIRTGQTRSAVLARHGLTPNDSRALNSLRSGTGRTMRSLANEWGCDASNATWIVDRLEKLGLAERRTTATDRRVKLVTLTPRGTRLKAVIGEAFHAPPAELLTLTRAELEALEKALLPLPDVEAAS